ncbi:MAG TPA: hypothetical protein VFZ21_31655, partial [Gemmatimonadaceae bacterium]|nr:hypothetical protein [Gemmatimonadaceae bacterium]
AVENPALSELLHSLRPGMSPMEQLSAVTRAYEIGRSERGQPEASSSTFLDSTAQQLMPLTMKWCNESPNLAGKTNAEIFAEAATLAYDAAHALLAERTRRQPK